MEKAFDFKLQDDRGWRAWDAASGSGVRKLGFSGFRIVSSWRKGS